MTPSPDQFIDIVRRDPITARLLDVLPALALPGAMLTAGCLFQNLWNAKWGLPAGHGVKDYDLFYHDDTDLSWEAEDAVIAQIKNLLGDLATRVDIKNQARVHLWYEERFHRPCPPLMSSEDGVNRFLILCTRVGIRLADGSLYLPDGIDDAWNGILRINPLNAQPDRFTRKCAEYQERWPELRVVDAIGESDQRPAR